MTLYHATIRDFAAGQTVVADRPCPYYPKAVQALEQGRPAGAPSRDFCLFASDNAAFAYFYVQQQGHAPDAIHLFEVLIGPSHRSPAVLVQAIDRRMSAGKDMSCMVTEYWAPTLDWRYWEYFGPSMQIIRELDRPKFSEDVIRSFYGDDHDKAGRLGAS